jgi:hypothetical protein
VKAARFQVANVNKDEEEEEDHAAQVETYS